MTLRMALLAATMLAAPLAAQAQPITGFYVGAGASVNLLQGTDITVTGPLGTALGGGSASRGSVDFDHGWAGVVSAGYAYGNRFRAEVEASYRENEVDSITGFAQGALRSDGKARSYGLMLNALYDFDLGPGSFVTPYLGLGVGYQMQAYSSVRARAANGNAVTIDGEQGRFAYQAIVGAAFPIASVPGLAITTEYRFMATLPVEIDARSSAGVRGNTEVDNFNHSVLIGLRYAFGTTPPPRDIPPIVMWPQATVPTYLVFFAFDSADLTDRARRIIDEATARATSGGTTRIELGGHADTSGTPAYNQRLSQRRVAAVAAELERRGVARSAMTIQAFGERRPLIPTADGVREPQNRRVEIVLR